jgi:hypothetical protein
MRAGEPAFTFNRMWVGSVATLLVCVIMLGGVLANQSGNMTNQGLIKAQLAESLALDQAQIKALVEDSYRTAIRICFPRL